MGRSKGRPQVSGFSGRTIGKMLAKSSNPAATPKAATKKKKK